MYDAKQTIERISRGHFRICIIQHGDGGRNREVQVVDTVEGFLVKGVPEQDLIAHILLDSRTASKHFGEVKAKTELANEAASRDGSRKVGLRLVLEENKVISPPKSISKKGGLPKLRNRKSSEQIQAESEEAERLAEMEDDGVFEEVIHEVEEAVGEEVSPSDLASVWEFDEEDAESLFVSIALAFGSTEVESYIASERPVSPLTLEFVQGMGEILSDSHKPSSKDPVVEVVDETGANGKRMPKVFSPRK